MRLRQHLQDNMVCSCLVGASHVGQGGKPTSRLPGARPKFFFAPSWTAQRIQELGKTSRNHNNNNTNGTTNAKRRGNKFLLHATPAQMANVETSAKESSLAMGLMLGADRTRFGSINSWYFSATDRVNAKEMRVAYCPTGDMVADFFVKDSASQSTLVLACRLLFD